MATDKNSKENTLISNSNDKSNDDCVDLSDKLKSFSFDPMAAKASLKQPPTVILPFLYIGTQYNASDKYIKEFNFQRILNLKDSHYSESPKVS